MLFVRDSSRHFGRDIVVLQFHSVNLEKNNTTLKSAFKSFTIQKKEKNKTKKQNRKTKTISFEK